MKILAFALPIALLGVVAGGANRNAAAATSADQAEVGKRLYLRCAACHSLSAKGPAKVGPHLEAVVGRRAGSIAKFAYSPALAKSGIVWNEATLDRWLQRPQAVVPGTTMAFAGMPDPAQRKALIAYMRQPK